MTPLTSSTHVLGTMSSRPQSSASCSIAISSLRGSRRRWWVWSAASGQHHCDQLGSIIAVSWAESLCSAGQKIVCLAGQHRCGQLGSNIAVSLAENCVFSRTVALLSAGQNHRGQQGSIDARNEYQEWPWDEHTHNLTIMPQSAYRDHHVNKACRCIT